MRLNKERSILAMKKTKKQTNKKKTERRKEVY